MSWKDGGNLTFSREPAGHSGYAGRTRLDFFDAIDAREGRPSSNSACSDACLPRFAERSCGNESPGDGAMNLCITLTKHFLP